MGKKAIGQYAVALTGPDGVTHSFPPGSTDYPDWAAKKMGPHCFEGGEDLFNEDGFLQAVIHHDAVIPEPRGGSGDGPPPRAGKGSGEDKWRAYAEANGVDVSGVDGRDEIIGACEDAGVPVE